MRRVRKNHNSRDAADAERYTRIELPTSYEEALQQALGHLSVQADKDRSDAGQLSIEEDNEHKRGTHQEKEGTEKKETENQDTEEKKITRRWQVFMSFDLPSTSICSGKLPEMNTLHSQLTIVGDTISATLWSESSVLCNKAKQQFSSLRNTLIANGLQVDELLCINGKPPNQKMSLDYHLVDITT